VQKNHSHLVVLLGREEADAMLDEPAEGASTCEWFLGVPADFLGTEVELNSSSEMAERLPDGDVSV
jgi:hypothetical protein